MHRIKSQVDMKDVSIRLSLHVIQRNSGSRIGMAVEFERDRGKPFVFICETCILNTLNPVSM